MHAVEPPTGDELLKILAALGNPHRMRILQALADGRNYVSGLARELGVGRPLLHMHLQRLEAAGLVVGTLELSEGGKAMKFFEVAPFAYELTPASIAEAARTLGASGDGAGSPPDPEDARPAPRQQQPEQGTEQQQNQQQEQQPEPEQEKEAAK